MSQQVYNALMDASSNKKTGFWLWHSALAWRVQLNRSLEPLGLTATQFFVLGSLNALQSKNLEPIAHGKISQFAGLDLMMTSRILQKLEKAHLVTRSSHADDKRKQLFSVTTSGRALASQATEIASETDKVFFKDSSPELVYLLQNLYLNKELRDEKSK